MHKAHHVGVHKAISVNIETRITTLRRNKYPLDGIASHRPTSSDLDTGGGKCDLSLFLSGASKGNEGKLASNPSQMD